jgi:hypothetical protein
MRLKNELYKKEQNEILDKIIDILKLDKDGCIILHEIDQDKNKQKKIMELIPDIRKYFSFTLIYGATKPDKAKRPYLSIIKSITKTRFKIMSCDHRYKKDGEIIRTKKYVFMKK